MIATEAASGVLHLIGTGGTTAHPVYQYDITLTNQGTASLGTFWLGWTPGQNLLPSTPTVAASPSGWSSSITTGNPATGGAGVQWVTASTSLAAGESLSGFQFSSSDSPATLLNQSPLDVTRPTLTAVVYAGTPLSSQGAEFVVSEASAVGLTSTTTELLSSVSTATAGESITFVATVDRQAGTTAPTGTVAFYDGITSLGTARVQPTGSATFSTVELTAGTHSVTAVYGGDPTYAGSTSPPVAEQIGQWPVLSVAIRKSTLPGTIIAGQAVSRAVTVGITNSTADTIDGTAYLEIYASTSGTIDASSVLIAGRTAALKLKSARFTAVSVPVKLLPASMPGGTYALVARVLGPGDVAADSYAGPALTVATPVVSLSETFSKLTLKPTMVSGSKQSATAVLRITNNGNVTLPATATSIGVFASVLDSADPGAAALGRIVAKLRLAPGKSALVTVPLIVSRATIAGTYSVFARVIDAGQKVSTADSGKKLVVT